MEATLGLAEHHSAYLSFVLVALCSFFCSLPKDLNPLSVFTLIFKQIANKVNLPTRSDSYKRLASLLSFALIYCPIALIISQLYLVAFQPFIVESLVLYCLLSWHDKMQYYKQIDTALQDNNMGKAKHCLAQIALRNTTPLSLVGINKATIESLILHLANGWFSVIFWYLLTGIYGALFYQLMNICAQQWNCKLSQYQALGQIPSFITKLCQLPVHILLSFTFSLYDKPIRNLLTKFKQSVDWHHFSSGLLLSSFALSIQSQLGGVRIYGEEKVTYANLGFTQAPGVEQVTLSIQRVTLCAWFWLFCISAYEFLPSLMAYVEGSYIPLL